MAKPQVSNAQLARNVGNLQSVQSKANMGEVGANIAPGLAGGIGNAWAKMVEGTSKVWGRLGTKLGLVGKDAGKLGALGASMEREVLFKGTKMALTKSTVIGTVAGTAIGGVSAGIRHRHTMKQLVLDYRPEVAATLGIPEEKVGVQELRRAARQIPALRQAIKVADFSAKMALPNGLVSTAAGFAGGAVGTMAMPLAGSIAGSIGASMASDYALRKVENRMVGIREGQTAIDAVQAITAKQQAGQAINAADVFAVHVAQDRQLDARIKARYGKRFSELDSRAKVSAMLDSPDKAKKSHAEAAIIGSGQARAQELVFARVKTVKGARIRAPESQLDKAAQELMKSGELPDLIPNGRQNLGKWTSMVNAEHRGPRHR